ncbi:MAG: penicillin-binding protein 2 [Acidobacteriota bacterium]
MVSFSTSVGENRAPLRPRLRFLVILGVIFQLVVLGRFFSVQVVEGEAYRELSEHNRLRRQPLEAARGVIYDRQGRVLAENVASYHLTLDPELSPDPSAGLAFAASVLEVPLDRLESELEGYRRRPLSGPPRIAENLSLAQVAQIRVAGFEYPGLGIEVRHLRLYRYGPHVAQLLGYLGEVSEQELRSESSPYRAGDQVGRRGVERAYEDRLRGADGERVVVVDSRGRVVEEYGRRAAQSGRDLRLTLDLELQQEAVEQLKGWVGAIVALDPRDGAVRAMASSPTYDSNLFSRGLSASQWRELITAEGDPLQNRGIQNKYSPGSVFKIVLGVAGLMEGLITPKDRVHCSGARHFYNHRFRCWKRSGHGWMDLEGAIAKSCDIYFYELGQRLGIERIAKYARHFGLGDVTGIGLQGEKPGLVPDQAWSLEQRRSPWYPGETISVAIGQGPVETTPLQVANLVAVVANGGSLVQPYLVEGEGKPSRPTDLDPEALGLVAQSLWEVVNGREVTGDAAAMEEMAVAGKTGTVQVVAQRTWIDSDSLPPEQRDHAWFAAYAPFEDPRLVVVAFVEHGGKGSKTAAPMVKALYEKYLEIEQRDLSAH